LDKLLRADKNRTEKRTRLYYMKDYCHGFCSFDFSKGVTEYANGSKVVIEAFKELFALCAEEPKIIQPEEPKII
jgi:hypothetical protein